MRDHDVQEGVYTGKLCANGVSLTVDADRQRGEEEEKSVFRGRDSVEVMGDDHERGDTG